MSPNILPSSKPRPWRFSRTGGVDQVVLRDGADIANLDALDQKLWMALAMPTRGVEFPPETADLLDTDKDGRIRPNEVIAAIQWARDSFADLTSLLKGGDRVALSNIKSPDLAAGARRILANLGKPDSDAIALDDVADQSKIFAGTGFNGDGVIPPEAADEAGAPELKKAIEEIAAALGSKPDRSGRAGIDRAALDAFFAQAADYIAWLDSGAAAAAPLNLTPESAAEAIESVKAIRAKIDDYFVRCRLAEFDARAAEALNREQGAYLALAAQDLAITSQEIAALPLSRIEALKALSLSRGVNPAWSAAALRLGAKALKPLMGQGERLTEADWNTLLGKLAPLEAWMAKKPAAAVEPLGAARLRELLSGDAKARLAELIDRDTALEKETAQIDALKKLLLFQRDLFRLLTNYVNFADFYSRNPSVFQAGTLYIAARACNLCIDVADPARHATVASTAGAYLAYCDLTRGGAESRKIVAVFTNGDAADLCVGRNGVFYDRNGRDWDATIVRIVSNPISVREAFWLPYRRLVRMIEEQAVKRVQGSADAASAKMSASAASIASAAPAKPAEPPKKLDLGTIALIGTAIGGISTLVAGLLQSMLGLGLWLPIGLVGAVLAISGPSMLLAWFKLRQRNLGPILDANGWAINTRALMSVSFGGALTDLPALPPGSERALLDPYAPKRRPWKRWVALAIFAVLFLLYWSEKLDPHLPKPIRKPAVLERISNLLDGRKKADPSKNANQSNDPAPLKNADALKESDALKNADASASSTSPEAKPAPASTSAPTDADPPPPTEPTAAAPRGRKSAGNK